MADSFRGSFCLDIRNGRRVLQRVSGNPSGRSSPGEGDSTGFFRAGLEGCMLQDRFVLARGLVQPVRRPIARLACRARTLEIPFVLPTVPDLRVVFDEQDARRTDPFRPHAS